VIVKGQHVLFKSMPVFVKSDGTTHPDARTLSFPITGTTMVGCCLCDGEVQAGRGGWGFKSHCLRSHAWMCNYEDLLNHNAGLLKVLESAYNEAVREEADPVAVGQKRKKGITAYLTSSKSVETSVSFREAVVKCVCLNLLPFTFAESPGFKTVLSFLSRSSEGLSARSIVTEMKALYTKMKLEKFKDFILAFDIKTGDDGKLIFEEEKHERICGVTHDLFTSANGNMPMLALNIHYINRRHIDGWKMTNFLLGCVEMPPPHSAANVFMKVKQICSFWDLPLSIFLAATQDTTGSSLNVFESVESTEQLPCFSHTNQLCMKWSVSDVESISLCFKKMSANNAKMKGKPKRLAFMEAAALTLVPPLQTRKPVLHCDTRWDIFDKVADNVFHNLPALLAIDTAVVFDKLVVRDAWESALQIIVTEKPVIQLVQPYLKLCAQWTQILSSRTSVTISLVRLAVRSLRQWEISAREANDRLHIHGSVTDRVTAQKMHVFLDSLRARQDQYFGDSFYNAGIFIVAEFLDPRTIWAIEDVAAFDQCKRLLKRLAPVAATRVPPAATARNSRPINPGGSFMSTYVAPLPAGAPRLSPLDLEIKDFITFLQTEVTEKEAMKFDPLEFFKIHEKRFPILAGIAVRVLSIPPSEAECERTFSITGRVHSKARNSLTGDHINQVVCLHQWLQMEAQNVSRASALRGAKTTARASRFATLKLIEETHFAPDPADVDDEDDEDV